MKLETLGEALKQAKKENLYFGQWKVQSDGSVKCTERDYVIASSRLSKGDWICHLKDKDWVNLNDFIPAYFKALEIQGINKLQMRIAYA